METWAALIAKRQTSSGFEYVIRNFKLERMHERLVWKYACSSPVFTSYMEARKKVKKDRMILLERDNQECMFTVYKYGDL